MKPKPKPPKARPPAAQTPRPAAEANPNPFAPRPRLFTVLLVVFLAWIGWLLYLYVSIVRHKPS
jgi:hypothetical protein